MGKMTALVALAALLIATPAPAEPLDSFAPFIVEAAQRFDVPIVWIERVIRAESGGLTRLGGRPITSTAGAMGLMQLMPGTWADMRATLGLGGDPHDPHDNILAGSYYLRLLYDRFGYPGLFAAYNAGPARYADYLAGRSGLPAETRAYLAKVGDGATPPVGAGTAPRLAPPSARPAPPALFFVRAATPAAPANLPADEARGAAVPEGLFVLLSGSPRRD